MSILVVGSIAFDTIKTPFGERNRALGGAANYFSMAAKFFNQVKMVGAIGDDFPKNHLDYLEKEGIDITGIAQIKGPSFHWHGEYDFDLNEAKTLKTEINIYENFYPILPESYKQNNILFLANIDPSLQISVLEQIERPKIVALDTMNYWINNKRDVLLKAIKLTDILFINDAEIRQLTKEYNIVKATQIATQMGAKIVVVKRGEFGSLLRFDHVLAFMPAFPLEDVFDPTGAGDVFAGGFLGYLSNCESFSLNAFKKAMMLGTVMSSFVIEKFSFDRLISLTKEEIDTRKNKLLDMISIIEI